MEVGEEGGNWRKAERGKGGEGKESFVNSSVETIRQLIN